MSELIKMYREITDIVIEKHRSGSLKWVPGSSEDSIETRVGNYELHIDKKGSPLSPIYKIWIFDEIGNIVNSFDTKELENNNMSLENRNYNNEIGEIYRKITDSITAKKIESFLEQLKKQ